MQHGSLIRQVLNRRQHDPSVCNTVSSNSSSLRPSPQGTLVEQYIVDCAEGRECITLLLVTSQPGFDLPADVSDIRTGGIAVKCSGTATRYPGTRFVINKQDQPILAKQGPKTFEIEAEVRAEPFVPCFFGIWC